MGERRRPEDGPNDWGASELHDWGVGSPTQLPQNLSPDPQTWDVRYDLSTCSRSERRTLTGELREDEVGFSWEGTDLLVSGEDEDHVDELVGFSEPNDKVDDGEAVVSEKPTGIDHLRGIVRGFVEVVFEAVANAIPW